MGNNIQELAEKLLHEGVERGNAEAEKIISAAKEKAAGIVKAANEEAQNIVAEAKKKADELDSNTKAELKMFNAQSINALKSEIANVVGNKIVKQTVSEVTGDKNFLHEFILRLAEKWAGGEDLVISTADAAALKSLFATKAKALLEGRYNVSFDDVKAVAFPALRHRIIPGFEAMADGIKVDEIIANIIASVPMGQ